MHQEGDDDDQEEEDKKVCDDIELPCIKERRPSHACYQIPYACWCAPSVLIKLPLHAGNEGLELRVGDRGGSSGIGGGVASNGW